MHTLPFRDGQFDLAWSHHSLEHSFCSSGLLLEWYRVIKPEGWLAITLPPHKTDVVSGHFHTGWTVGQLLYLLGIAGFDLRTGVFLEEGYNVRALVQRPSSDVDPIGLSWLSVLRDRLPQALIPHMVEQPTSLGRYNFPGRIKFLSDEKCEFF
jgi:SAM-dependent methyltransferase